MKKKLWISVLILVGALVLAGGALAADPQVTDGQTTEPVVAPTPAKEGKAADGQTKAPATAAKAYDGKVVDAQTKAPIAGALVTLGDQQVRADKDGAFHLEGAGETLKLRAPGYARRELPTAELTGPTTEIALTPLHGQGAVPLLLRARQQENTGSGQGSH